MKEIFIITYADPGSAGVYEDFFNTKEEVEEFLLSKGYSDCKKDCSYSQNTIAHWRNEQWKYESDLEPYYLSDSVYIEKLQMYQAKKDNP